MLISTSEETLGREQPPTGMEPAPAALVLFERRVPGIGTLQLRRLSLARDIPTVHAWVSREYAAYWGLTGRSLDAVREAYVAISRSADVYLGSVDDRPAFLVECYDPARDVIGEHYAVEPGDRGMHVLVAPAAAPIHGFTWAVFGTVMDFLFSEPRVTRVVVEPDIRNEKIHALNRRAGFRYERAVELPHKVAHLAFCTRADYFAARDRDSTTSGDSPLRHLTRDTWLEVNAHLLAKAVAEFSHERLLLPRLETQADEYGRFTLSPGDGIEYRFEARVLALDHWLIRSGSLEKTRNGTPAPLDALDFMLEFAGALEITPANLLVYLEEIASTLYAAAYKRENQRLSTADLVHAPFQEVEAAMSEGHPAFVANSGRVGFDAADYRRYAPEVGASVRLVWLALRRERAEFSCTRDLSYERLIAEELGDSALSGFRGVLVEQGLEPSDYFFMPVHPWQWDEKLTLLFASDIAARDIVCLGASDDVYQAQQSIRTFFNLSKPRRRYVKMALSVLNMGFMRGLSADYLRGTPAINDWVRDRIAADPYFADKRFRILREVAGIAYRKAGFEAALPKASPYRKMLAALFRESPIGELAPGQRLLTMAALLHCDRDGTALLPELIRASGLDTDAWLRRYLDAYLAPLLHCFYAHDLAFMPHGENVILVLEGNAPAGVWLKDIAEEVAFMGPSTAPLPELVRRIAVAVPDHARPLCIFTDIFDGFLRFMSAVLLRATGYAPARFWLLVAECVGAYQAQHPELANRFERDDLFAPTFAHSCLNRLQLRNNRQMLDLQDPVGGLAFAGSLENPIAEFRALVRGSTPPREVAPETR